MKENIFNIIKVINEKIQIMSYSVVKEWKLPTEAQVTRQGYLFLPFLLNVLSQILATLLWQIKEIKAIIIRNVELSWLRDNMI